MRNQFRIVRPEEVCEQEHVEEYAIEVKNVVKVYKLYEKLRDRMYDALGLKKNNYKLYYALNGVNLNVKKGECVGIIGTNGSGKSTLLKIITGVLNPTSGEVNVAGRISALLELGAGFNMEYSGIPRRKSMKSSLPFWSLRISETMCISLVRLIPAVCSCVWPLQLPSTLSRRF